VHRDGACVIAGFGDEVLIANAVRVVGEDTKLLGDARHADSKIGNTPSSKKRPRMIEFVLSKC